MGGPTGRADYSTVYLAGPINGCTDAEARAWRVRATELLGSVLNPMDRDYRGRETDNVAELVEADKADIDAASAVLAYCPTPSVGTSMEVLYAWLHGKHVVAVVPEGTPVSPWLAYHSTVVPSLERAADILKGTR